MAELYLPTELQDDKGNVIYPHTEAGLVFTGDGGTVEESLNEKAEVVITDENIPVDQRKKGSIYLIKKSGNECNVEVQDYKGNVYHPIPDIIRTKEELEANTDPGKTPDSLLVKRLNSDLSAMNDNGAIVGMDAREDGVYITYTPPGGADPVSKKLGSGLENIKIRIWGTGGDQDPAGKGRIEGLTSPKIHIKTDSYRSYADINVSVTSASGSTKTLIDIDGKSSSSVWNNETVHDLSGWQNDMPYTLNATCYVVGITVWFED